jgi:hypothetical protein
VPDRRRGILRVADHPDGTKFDVSQNAVSGEFGARRLSGHTLGQPHRSIRSSYGEVAGAMAIAWLRRKVHAADQVLESRLGPQAVEFGVGLQKTQVP